MSNYKNLAIIEMLILLILLGLVIIYLLIHSGNISGISFLTGR